MKQADLLNIMSGEHRSPAGELCRVGLASIAPFYRLGVSVRNRLFDAGVRETVRLPRPTISVGNITTGGTGKTPMVLDLAQRLAALGVRPAVLLRGHGGAMTDDPTSPQGRPPPPRGRHSDEQRLYEQALEGTPVAADPDRLRAARHLLYHHPDVNALLLDDAFQHRQVHRDLDLVLIDATRPFGYGRVLPRGLLREPPENLRRAHGVILTRVDQVDQDELAELEDRLAALTHSPPLARAAYRWTGFRGPEGEVGLDHLADRRVVAVTGIGNPAAFEHALRDRVHELHHHHIHADHHPYTRDELARLHARARAAGAKALVTTEKDWVKWTALEETTPSVLPVYRPVLSVQFNDDGQAIDALLRQTLRDRS